MSGLSQEEENGHSDQANNKEIGERLQRIRKQSNYKTQKKFAQAVGLSQGMISLIEKGENKLSPKHIPKIQQIRIDGKRINMDWLYTGLGEVCISEASGSEIPVTLNDLIKRIELLDSKKQTILINLIQLVTG